MPVIVADGGIEASRDVFPSGCCVVKILVFPWVGVEIIFRKGCRHVRVSKHAEMKSTSGVEAFFGAAILIVDHVECADAEAVGKFFAVGSVAETAVVGFDSDSGCGGCVAVETDHDVDIVGVENILPGSKGWVGSSCPGHDDICLVVCQVGLGSNGGVEGPGAFSDVNASVDSGSVSGVEADFPAAQSRRGFGLEQEREDADEERGDAYR